MVLLFEPVSAWVLQGECAQFGFLVDQLGHLDRDCVVVLREPIPEYQHPLLDRWVQLNL
jgi:hypothetical protein